MNRIKNFFASLKTAIFLICFLTLLAIMGTLIPQRLEAINYISAFPKTWQLILWLGFDDMYRSYIFIGTLALLSISAIVCVIIRWKSVHKKLFYRDKITTQREILKIKTSKNIEKSFDSLKLDGFTIFSLPDETKVAFKSSGKMALLGGLILHIGLVLIFAGGLLGLIFGVEMSITGKAGEKIPVPSIDIIRAAYKADNLSRKARHIRQFFPLNPELEKMRAEIENLHNIYNDGLMHPEFKIAFDKLWIEHYSNSNGEKTGVKSWNVEVRFIDVASGSLFAETNETSKKLIRVNEPVGFKEWNFYLANWHKNWEKIKLNIEFTPNVEGYESYKPQKDDFPKTIEVGPSEPFEIEGFPYLFIVSEFYPDFRTSNGVNFSATSELNNPVAKITAFDKEKQSVICHSWAFPSNNSFMTKIHTHSNQLPFKFVFQNAESNYECILQMAYDPGTILVWLGCSLFCLGMMFCFYIKYKEEWVLPNKDRTVFIAVYSNSSEDVLKKELTVFEEELVSNNKEANQ